MAGALGAGAFACDKRPTNIGGTGGGNAGTGGGAGGTTGGGAGTTGAGGGGVTDGGADLPTGAGGVSGVAGRAGTGGRTGTGGLSGAGGAFPGWQVLEEPISNKLDLLFMIDNSQSMLPMQSKLLASFPTFMNVLKALPMGLPDLHLAVISSDTGPGKYDLPDRHCAFVGDGGRFHSLPGPSATCSAPLAADQHFLSASQNQMVKNYTGDISDAFSCIAALGDQGCGFEGQLKSVRWALDPLNPPIGNEGFLRNDAYLAVVLVTNEDDCSIPDDSDLVDPLQTRMSDPLGPLWSFRCNEFGHLCNIGGVLQPPPRGPATSNLQGCMSNETASSKLLHVADEVGFLRSLKTNPKQILVSAISGPPTPYSLEMIQNPMDVEMHPNIVHSCTQNSGEYADPAVRIKQWVDAFGDNGLFQSICAASFAPALQVAANKIGGVFNPACVNGPFPAVDGGTHPACRVVDLTRNSVGGQVVTRVQHCLDNGNAAPCWSLQADANGCLDGQRLVINRGTLPPPPGLSVAFTCAPCQPGTNDPSCP